MDFWTNLGIEKTTDIDAINAAYHRKLPLVNPEDKPEEFKALRAEYDEAIRYAREQEQQVRADGELTPVEQWVRRLEDIYSHIARRCDVEEWQALLSDPLCAGIDSRMEVRDAMLHYFVDNWYLPQNIWKLLDGYFHLQECADELYEKFSKDFVDNAVLDGINGSQFVPYELFLPQNSGNIDPFFSLFFKARRHYFDGEYDSAEAALNDLEATGIQHPYADLLRLKLELTRANGVPDDLLFEKARTLYGQYPEDTEFISFYADLLSQRGDQKGAIEFYDKVLETEPHNNNVRYHKAQSLMNLEEYKAAKELFAEINQDMPFNEYVRNGFEEANKKMTEQYAALLEQNPDDFTTRMEYAWCVFQQNDYDKTKELLDIPVPRDVADRCDYENISTKFCCEINEYEDTLRHAQAWREAVTQLPEGATKEEKHRKNKLGEIAFYEAVSLAGLHRWEEAMQKTDETIAADPDEYRVYHVRYAFYKNQRHDYDKAIEACREMIRIKPGGSAYHMLGCAQYLNGMMQEAFNSFGTAIGYVKDQSSYTYRANILCLYDEFDQAQEIIDLLEQNNIDTDDVRYCKSMLLVQRDKKEDEAREIWQSIIDRDEKGESDCEWMWEVCNDMAVYMIRHDADPNEILAVIDRGLKALDDYSPLLMNKGYILDEKLDRHEDALECYRKVYEKNPRHTSVCERMAGIYYYDLHDIRTALDFYTEQAKRADSAFCEGQLGNCLRNLDNYPEAEKHFKAALELEPENERAHSGYIMMLERCGNYEQALSIAQKLSEIVGDRSGYAKRIIARLKGRTGQCAEAADIHISVYQKFSQISDIDTAADYLLAGGLIKRYLALLQQYKNELGDDYWLQLVNYYDAVGDDRKWLKALRSMSEHSHDKWRYLANYHYQHGDYKKALTHIEQYFALEPDSIMDRYLPIECRKRLGLTDHLEELFQQGLNAVEKDNVPWYQPLYFTKKAYLLIAMERYEEAKQCIDKALASPLCEHCKYQGCIDGYDALAQYYEAIGDYNASAAACMEGLKRAPYDPDCWERLRRLRKLHKKELNKEYQK